MNEVIKICVGNDLKEIPIPVNYRLCHEGDILKEGDMFCSTTAGEIEWIKTCSIGYRAMGLKYVTPIKNGCDCLSVKTHGETTGKKTYVFGN